VSVTTEGKIKDSSLFPILRRLNGGLSRLSRKYYVDRYVKKKNLNELKSSYIECHQISGRHFNSIRQDVDGKVKAKQKIADRLIKERKEQISATLKTIKKSENKVKNLRQEISAIESYRDKMKTWKSLQGEEHSKKRKPKLAKKWRNENLKKLYSDLKKETFKIHQKKRRLGILKGKLANLEQEAKSPSLCFGSQELFNKQHHLGANGYSDHVEWLEDWRFFRNRQSYFMGSHEETNRNQNAQYDIFKKALKIRLPGFMEKEFGAYAHIPVEFTYKNSELADAIVNTRSMWCPKKNKVIERHIPVSYRIIEKEPGEFYVQATFAEREKEAESRKDLGAIGIDLNEDHFAVCETDRFGNPIDAFSLPFDKNLTSNQRKAVFGDHIAFVVDRAQETGKILVAENIDFAGKKQALRERYGKRHRVCLSNFAYELFHTMLSVRCARKQVKLKRENPAFTSIVGFFKFRGYKKLSSHEQAALAIARRGLGFSERPKTKNALSGTVGIHGVDDTRVFFSENSVGHVWSYFNRNKSPIRLAIIESSLGKGQDPVYHPRYASGYIQCSKRDRVRRPGTCSSSSRRGVRLRCGSNTA